MPWLKQPDLEINDGRVAVEREGAGAFDFEVHELSLVAGVAIEEDDAVAAGAAGVAGGVFLAGAFDEDLHLLSDEVVVFAGGDAVDEVEEAMVAFLADF